MNNQFVNNLIRQAEENPAVVLGVTAALITSISKLVNASANKQNSVAWRKEVRRREIKDTLKK